MSLEPWLLALIVKPLAVLVLFGLVVIPLELAARGVLPKSLSFLFDPTLRDRQPQAFNLIVIFFTVALVAAGAMAAR